MRYLATTLLLATLVSSCNGQADGADELVDAVHDYNSSFLAGDAPRAWLLLSSRCRDRLPEGEFTTIVSVVNSMYPGVVTTDVRVDDRSGDLARVTSRFTNAELDQASEPWVREAGHWLNDDC